jgi:hypothetical protein
MALTTAGCAPVGFAGPFESGMTVPAEPLEALEPGVEGGGGCRALAPKERSTTGPGEGGTVVSIRDFGLMLTLWHSYWGARTRGTGRTLKERRRRPLRGDRGGSLRPWLRKCLMCEQRLRRRPRLWRASWGHRGLDLRDTLLQGLLHGLRDGLQHGLRHGLRYSLRHDLRYGLRQALWRRLVEVVEDGLVSSRRLRHGHGPLAHAEGVASSSPCCELDVGLLNRMVRGRGGWVEALR